MTQDTRIQSLADFLLERIAEDESTRGDKHDRWDCSLRQLEMFGDCTCKQPARVLAECEAKRRIIDWVAVTVDDFHACDGIKANMRIALKDLAKPYADHPDYREEWRIG